jgi:nucleoside-diphosphate-sugar epimerase
VDSASAGYADAMSSTPEPGPPATGDAGLTVAVTGPTGTLGHGLLPLLEADDRVARVVGIARRPFDPQQEGWSKVRYQRADVRDRGALADAFGGADVVVHLAFLVISGSRGSAESVNVEGSVNAFLAAAQAGARRFVHASSVAAYGFHEDNPVGMTEDWPTRPADHLYYAQEKSEIEKRLQEEAAAYPGTDLYVLRPATVLGPHALGAKVLLPPALARLGAALGAGWRRLPVPVPLPVPDVPLQLVHEADVGSALLQCIVGAGPAGAYNIAADAVSSVDIARELGVVPLPVPAGPVQAGARALAQLPGLPPVAQWVEAVSHPAVMDTSKARSALGWTPQYSALEALRDTTIG